jgi:hypothetical protein
MNNHTFTVSCSHNNVRYKFIWDSGMEKKDWNKAIPRKKDTIKLDAKVCIRRNIQDEEFRKRFNAEVSDDDCDINIAEGSA